MRTSVVLALLLALFLALLLAQQQTSPGVRPTALPPGIEITATPKVYLVEVRR